MHFFFFFFLFPPVKEVPTYSGFFPSLLSSYLSFTLFSLCFFFFFLLFFGCLFFLHQWGLIVPLAGQILFLPLFWPNPRG